jgi:[ribosomal protein S5]-alanine N-acetyltransferase
VGVGVTRQTERLLLRDIRVEDADALVSVWVDEDVARFMDDFGPRTPEDVRAWIPTALAAYERDATSFGWALELRDGGDVIGWIGFGRSARGVAEMDIAYVVAAEHRGRGYASEALRAVIAFCFDELGARSVWGECAIDNSRSAAVMQRAGMAPIGVEGDQRRFVLRTS